LRTRGSMCSEMRGGMGMRDAIKVLDLMVIFWRRLASVLVIFDVLSFLFMAWR